MPVTGSIKLIFRGLLLILSVSLCCGSLPIPGHLLVHLRNASTMQELLSKMKFFRAPNNIGSVPRESYVKTAGFGTSSLNGNSDPMPSVDVRKAIVYKSSASVEIIENPVQSRDSCIVHPVCAPVPLRREPHYFYFPECIDLPQCLGGCCDNSQNCRPSKTVPLKVKVSAWKYSGTVDGEHKFMLHDTFYAPIEKHVTCSCDSCPIRPVCKKNQQLVGCHCECKNMEDAKKCTGSNHRNWSIDTCTCDCVPSACPNDQLFSMLDCGCRPRTDFGLLKNNRNLTGTYLTRDEYQTKRKTAK